MKNIYGYIYNNDFIETGFTEKGAKIAAKKVLGDDCDLEVGYRSPINNMYIKTSSWCHIMEQWLKVIYNY